MRHGLKLARVWFVPSRNIFHKCKKITVLKNCDVFFCGFKLALILHKNNDQLRKVFVILFDFDQFFSWFLILKMNLFCRNFEHLVF